MGKRYLIRRGKGTKPITHIWLGDDTACRMVSTGGIKIDSARRRWVQIDRIIGSVCQMCKTNHEKGII